MRARGTRAGSRRGRDVCVNIYGMGNTTSETNRAAVAPCACGCGQLLKQRMVNGRVVLYRPGHQKVKDGRPLHSLILVCPQCRQEFKRGSRRRFCSLKCYFEFRGLEYKGRNRVYAKADRSEFREVTSRRLQRLYLLSIRDRCESCGWMEYVNLLEVHHVDHNRRNGKLENLVLLCPTCHEVRHFLEKSGRYDPLRFERAARVRAALGPTIPTPRGVARTTVQHLMDEGRLRVPDDIEGKVHA